jgi:hypothetical protein
MRKRRYLFDSTKHFSFHLKKSFVDLNDDQTDTGSPRNM